MTHAPSPDTAPRDRAARPGRGLVGRLDTPTGPVAAGTALRVGGWVVHERMRVRQVLVTVGDAAAHTHVDVARPDVRDRWPGVADATHRGWAVTLPAPPADATEVTVRAYALVEPAAGAGAGAIDDDSDGDPTRLGPWLRFAEATVPVVASGDAFGMLDDPEDVELGVVRVTGTARAPGGLARVELTTDDGVVVRARHSLPVPGAVVTDLDERLAGFAGHVRATAPGPLTVRATAVGLDGRRHDLEPRTVEVAAPAPTITAARAGALLERFERRTAALAVADGVRPRVLVASHALDLGGAQLYLSLLLDRLHARGIDVCVAARAGGALQAALEARGVPVLVHGTDPRDPELLEGQVLQVAEFAREHGAVGCLANSLPTFPAVIAAQRLGLPTTWAVHESFDLDVFWDEAFGGLPAEVAAQAARALAACDEVVFEATSTEALYRDLVPDGHRAVVPYGVDRGPLDTVLGRTTGARERERLGIPEDALVLTCVGTVEPRKAQLSLVRAFAALPASRREGVHLVVVGMNDRAYARALRDVVNDAGLADSVQLVDVTPDIHGHYLAADVLVSASDVESMPRTMLEAMALGRPVAATAAFGVAELVTDGRTGFLCEPLDLGALRAMLERVISTDRAVLATMGSAARVHVTTAHDPRTYLDHFATRLASWLPEPAP